MIISPENVKVGTLVRLEEGSYFCENVQRYVPISHCQIGLVIFIFEYDESSYPWAVLGYKFLADVVIGTHRLRDVPDFKLYEVRRDS
tara:strand:+ start:1049 stop:1309 length:261 start_codon:yes stop_codon:yes gene_type:complete